MFIPRVIIFLTVILVSAASAASDTKNTVLRGVNLAGGGFASNALPGIYGQNYIYPAPNEIRAFANLGMNVIRLSFLWERLQPELNKPLDPMELGRIDAVVNMAAAMNMTTILDVHNFGMYRGKLIGTKAVPTSSFSDFWERLASHYKNDSPVAFGLMNEPNKQSAEAWAAIAQAAITSIRNIGARQLILIPGTRFSSAKDWTTPDGRLSNAQALANIVDSAHNFVFEAHQYFDTDTSGTHPDCVSAHIGEERLASFTEWLRKTGHRGFLGEFGASSDPVCIQALKNTLEYMSQQRDAWLGWSYWVSGAWLGNYMFNIYPPDDRHPQVKILKEYLDSHAPK